MQWFTIQKTWIGILNTVLDYKLSFSAHISLFYVMFYNSKHALGFINTDLDSKLKKDF